jgi:hypothetical protein
MSGRLERIGKTLAHISPIVEQDDDVKITSLKLPRTTPIMIEQLSDNVDALVVAARQGRVI